MTMTLQVRSLQVRLRGQFITVIDKLLNVADWFQHILVLRHWHFSFGDSLT